MAFDTAIAFGLTVISLGFFYIAMHADKDKLTGAAMQLLFAGLGMFFIIADIQILAMIAEVASELEIAGILWTLYGGFTMSVIFILGVWLVAIVYDALQKLRNQARED